MTELLANLQSQIFLIENRKSDPDFKNNFRDLSKTVGIGKIYGDQQENP